MSAVAVGGAVWALAVLVGLLVVGSVVHRVHRWAHRARQRRLPIIERTPGPDREIIRVRGPQ